MADNPYDRVIFNEREKPLSSDWNRQIAEFDRTIRHMAKCMFGRGLVTGAPAVSTPSLGFIGSGFWVRPKNPAAMQVVVNAGQGFLNVVDVQTDIDGVLALDDRDSYKPLLLMADQTINVPAADATNARIDIVEVKYKHTQGDNASRLVLNSTTGRFEPSALNKTLSWTLDGSATINGSGPINYKTGTPAGSPAAPATTAGYVKIAEVLVGAAVATIAENKITDLRGMLSAFGIHQVGIRCALNSDGSFTPGITDISLPPGMQCSVVGLTANTGYICIIPGMTPIAVTATPHVSPDTANTDLVALTAAIGTISSGEQTELAGAGAAPALAVAIGQPRIKISYTGITFSEGTGQQTAWAGGSGTHPFKTIVNFTAGQMVVA